MSISFVRVTAPDEEDCNDRHDHEIAPTLPVVLGRGSLLKCGDKRISRRHAYLDWDDDAVMLTSVHQNPTFVIAKGAEKVLTEGDSCLLYHGDKFGLLKTNFWYRINLPNSSLEEQKSPAADPQESKKSITSTTIKEISPATPLQKSSGEKDEATDKTTTTSMSTNHTKENEEESIPDIKENSASSDKRKIPTKDPALEVSNTALSSVEIEEQKENDPPQGNSVKKAVIVATAQTLSVEELQKAVISRKRELPTWLQNINPSDKAAAQNKEAQNCHGGGRKSRPPSTKTKLSNVASDTHADSGVQDSVVKQTNTNQNGKNQEHHDKGGTSKIKINELSKNKEKTPSPRKNASPSKSKGSPLNSRTKGLHVLSDDSGENSGSEDNRTPVSTPKKTVSTPKNAASPPKKNDTPKKKTSPKVRSPVKHDVSDDEDEESSDKEDDNASPNPSNAVSPSRTATRKVPSPKKQPRQNCQFGASCYRKNPKHLADFAHIGDPDYKADASASEDDDEDDDRPQCEYGVDCYRKNLQHKKDFRHSRVPQPQRRAKRKARQQRQRGDGSDSDDYDYDDPFLNDDSSDDYAPTDSGDDSPMDAEGDEEEDTKRMLKEGKKFVKKR